MILLEASAAVSPPGGDHTAIWVALIAAMSSLAGTYLVARQGKQVKESHRMLTVNHHSSEQAGLEPTILDRIDDLKQLVLGQGHRLNDHITHSNGMDERLVALEELIKKK